MDCCYFLPGLRLTGDCVVGRGVVTDVAIKTGTVVAVYGGRVAHATEFAELTDYEQTHALQIAEELFIVTIGELELGDFINHSCEPNLGSVAATMLVARRDIDAGEEVTFDYAMTDGDPYDEFECLCGAPSCRGKVTGDDWMRRELWGRYAGYFSPYLQARIDRLRDEVD